MEVYYDAEFLEDGETIGLISLALLGANNSEYVAINAGMDVERIGRHDWLCKNVVPHLPLVDKARVLKKIEHRAVRNMEFTDEDPLDFELDLTDINVKPVQVIANEVREFLRVPNLVLVSWYSGYDHVRLCQLWGPMVAKPPHVPMWTYDLRQAQYELGVPDEDLPRRPEGESHDVLSDARYHRQIARFLKSRFGTSIAVGA